MASLQPKNSGGPVTKFWESPEIVTALEHVKSWLVKHAKKVKISGFSRLRRWRRFAGITQISWFPSFFQHVQSDPPTAKSLSQLIVQMIQFQEDNLGKNAKNPSFPRLPLRHFIDFTPDGPLCHILSSMHQFKSEQGWRRWDFSSPSRKDANIEMCQKAEEALEKKGYHLSPRIMFHKSLSKEDKTKSTELIKKMKGVIVDNEDEATHILYPSVDPDLDMFCRGVFKKGDKCLVHFYRMPESHDNWGQMWPPEDKEPAEGK